MKTLLIGVAMLASVVCAQADTSTYVWLGKGQWTNETLQAAAQVFRSEIRR